MTTAAERYRQLAIKREPFLTRARDFATLTVPSVAPPAGQTYTAHLPQPFCGMSGRAVLHLSAKLMASLMPPGSSIFRLDVTPEALIAAGKEAADADVQRTLSLIEQHVHTEVERRMWRPKLFLAEQHLIVTGNVLLGMNPDNTLVAWRLDQYVCVRDVRGQPMELIIEEAVDSPDGTLLDMIGPIHPSAKSPFLYTHCTRQPDGSWVVYQEVEGRRVPGSEGEYPAGLLPFYPLRWAELVGEHYGRSKVEEHEADHRFAEVLTMGTGDGAAIASRALIMVRPNAGGGLNLRRRVRDARSGSVIIGDPDDVDFKSFQGVQGFQFAAAELANVKRDMAAAYLMNSAVQRNGERVTAYEMRQMIEEIEGALGGVYTLQATEMISPLVHRLMHQMQRNKQLPDLKDGLVAPTILTGLAALGREADFRRVAEAVQLVSQAPQDAAAYINWSDMFTKALVGIGLASSVFSQEQVQEIRQQQALMQAMQSAAAPVAGQVAGAMVSQPEAQAPA